MNNLFRSGIALILSVLLVSGCGWHLRGHNDALQNVQSVHISGRNLQSPLIQTLKRDLKSIDVVLSTDAASAQYSIIILDERSSRRTATVSASARVAEYQLTEEVDLLILGADGIQQMPRTTLTLERVFEFDEDNVLAKDDEMELLRHEMRANLSRQIIDRLRLISSRPANAKPAVTEDAPES
ncbi:MAG: LPS assembly lipoprotein LptE [Porticoccaceae bacterium]|nr:hypothetical protein [Pseudomonadales bacterium]MCP5172717.1 hypothetical protein [Pseudomonadales bacterium]MCP5302191.1 hypothetical protein [Pseudomonadales bacterium]